jgi:Fe-S-cluster-containing dehydrogenase component/DMSO reductase anchor subunit
MTLAQLAPSHNSTQPALEIAGPVLLQTLLREQQTTAVEKFAQWHDRESESRPARQYHDLIPLSEPGPGEQYAFEVDLDACSGCKACVTACHSLNGLEEDETWRTVGLLHGGSTELSVLQHVTTACHQCLEPACLEGCPVEAYVKDPVTGIVRHLDDQCFGCQYCILKCPYDVPKYSHRRGIVRKCDMCHQRLAVGEAPACVQACPNQAIRIRVVDREETAENAEANLFLPGAPEPGYTLPTTVYKTKRALPQNLLPADYYSATPQHAHWPLVLMLVLTQMSVGAFFVDQALGSITQAAGQSVADYARTVHLAAAFVLGIMGLAASICHLGRPWLAYRAVIGWRRSWLSREAIAFGGFALLASIYAGLPLLELVEISVPFAVQRILGAAVALSGLAGIFCSAMIYGSTRRPFWNAGYTGLKFLLTCLVLGIPVALLIELGAAAASGAGTIDAVMKGPGVVLLTALVIAAALKLLAESAIFAWLGARNFKPLRRTALLMTGELGPLTMQRFLLGLAGGVVLPSVLLTVATAQSAVNSLFAVLAVILVLAVCFAGEVMERYLFFAAVVAPKMPGVPAT